MPNSLDQKGPLGRRSPTPRAVRSSARSANPRTGGIRRTLGAVITVVVCTAVIAVLSVWLISTLAASGSPNAGAAPAGTATARQTDIASLEPTLTPGPSATSVPIESGAPGVQALPTPSSSPMAAGSTNAPQSSPIPSATSAAVVEVTVPEPFWDRVTNFGMYGLTYGSLEEIVDHAHLVVVGRVVDTSEGTVHPYDGPFGPSDLVLGTVAVDEVLKGLPVMRQEGKIEVAELGWQGIDAADLPKGQSLLFLMNDAQQRAEYGYPASDEANERYRYWRPNGYQAVIPNVGGRAHVVGDWSSWQRITGQTFPGDVDGMRFSDLVSAVREHVRNAE